MAGDWIKVRTDLATSPKVVRISSALKADRLRTVGALHAVWCLFDAHSEDGTLIGYSSGTVDDLIGYPGFSAAMVSVGWLIELPEALELPRFDDHNGKSAKRRAQDSDRKKGGRLSASDADKKRTREEKRREEIDQEPIGAPTAHHVADAPASTVPEEPAQPVKPKAKRGTRLPAGWSLPTEWAEWAASDRTEFTRADIARVAESFADYWHAASKNAAKLDWFATWRNWFRNQRAPASNVRQFPAKKANGPDFYDTSWRFATEDDL